MCPSSTEKPLLQARIRGYASEKRKWRHARGKHPKAITWPLLRPATPLFASSSASLAPNANQCHVLEASMKRASATRRPSPRCSRHISGPPPPRVTCSRVPIPRHFSALELLRLQVMATLWGAPSPVPSLASLESRLYLRLGLRGPSTAKP